MRRTQKAGSRRVAFALSLSPPAKLSSDSQRKSPKQCAETALFFLRETSAHRDAECESKNKTSTNGFCPANSNLTKNPKRPGQQAPTGQPASNEVAGTCLLEKGQLDWSLDSFSRRHSCLLRVSPGWLSRRPEKNIQPPCWDVQKKTHTHTHTHMGGSVGVLLVSFHHPKKGVNRNRLFQASFLFPVQKDSL